MHFLICTVDLNPCPPENAATVSLSEVLDPALLGLTPASLLGAFGFGFGAVLLMWFIGYALGLAVGVIRKV
jgi:hypothetical protein